MTRHWLREDHDYPVEAARRCDGRTSIQKEELDDHDEAGAPRRSTDAQADPLSLNGGGIRASLTLEYLALIEDMLARAAEVASSRTTSILIGGTSTGSIIAAALACGP
jgi:hypothetical protein